MAFTVLIMTRQSGFLRVYGEHRKLSHPVFKKIIHEIGFARKLKLNVPSEKGVPKLYIEYLGKLYVNSKFIPKFESAIERLFYLYAVMNLYTRINSLPDTDLSRRQLIKNAMFVFVTGQLRKKGTRFKKIIAKRFYPSRQNLYKVLSGKSVSKVIIRNSAPSFKVLANKDIINFSCVFQNSYSNYHGKEFTVRNYIDTQLPVECYEIKTNCNEYKFVLETRKDKMKFSYSQTNDTFFYVCNATKKAHAIFVMCDKKEFGTSLAKRRTSNLEIHLGLSGYAKVFVITGESKQETISVIQQIRDNGGRLDYLLNKDEITKCNCVSKLLEQSYYGRYFFGEDLRKKFLATCKIIPTLHLPTYTYIVESQEDFFDIVDSFPNFKRLADIGISFNIIILYSQQNDIVREIVSAFMNTDEVRILIENGVFVFFVDRITANSDIVYYLCKMNEGQNKLTHLNNLQHPISSNPRVLVSSQISGNTLSIFLNNKSNKEAETSVFIPINLGREIENSLFTMPCVVSRNGSKLKILSQKTGHSYTLKLPNSVLVYDNLSRIIEEHEHSCSIVILKLEAKIKAYGEKIIEIKKEGRSDLVNMHKVEKESLTSGQSA